MYKELRFSEINSNIIKKYNFSPPDILIKPYKIKHILKALNHPDINIYQIGFFGIIKVIRKHLKRLTL